MQTRRWWRVPMPSPTMVVALAALFVALAGSATAAVLVTSADIQNGTIRGIDVRNGTLGGLKLANSSLRGLDVANNSLTGADVNEATLNRVPIADRAVTISKLAPEVGLELFTGRVNDLVPFTLGGYAPVSGMAQADTDPEDVFTLSPDRPIRMRELAAELTKPVLSGAEAGVELLAFVGNTVVASLACGIPVDETECASAGPSAAVVPPRSHLVLLLNLPGSTELAFGTDLLFSWRAQAP
jgi:hypothetical protein